METESNNEDLFGWSKNAVYGSLAILLLILGIATTAYFVGKNNTVQTRSPIPVIDLASRSPQVLGATLFNVNGTVIDINVSEGTLTVQTVFRDDQGQLQQKQITVLVDRDVEIIRWDVTQAPTEDEVSNRTAINLSDLKAGSQVTVQTEDDVRASDRITAQALHEMITPFSN